MPIKARDIAGELANAGVSGGAEAIEGNRVVLHSSNGHAVWAEECDGIWEIHNSDEKFGPAATPQQTPAEIARALVREFEALRRRTASSRAP